MKLLPIILISLLTGCTSQPTMPPSPLTTGMQDTQSLKLNPRTMLLSAPEPLPLSVSVTLAWNPSPDSDVVGYNLYYGGVSGSYTNKLKSITTTNVLVTGLIEGVFYYFAATAFNAAGLESPFSNEAHWPPYAPVLTGFTLTGNGAVKQSTDLRNWTAFTNLTGSIGLPLTGGSKFFKGTNKLTIKPVWVQP